MYSAFGAVCSAVVDQQIGDDAVTRRRRLAGRRRAGTAAFGHVHSCIHHDAELVYDSLWYIEQMQFGVKKPRQPSLELLRGFSATAKRLAEQ